MKEKTLSARQLAAAAFAGGLAPAAAAARFGWQGAALAAPVLLLAGGILLKLSSRWANLRGTAGETALRVGYTFWGAIFFSRWLRRSGQRLEVTGGGEPGTAVWILLLLAVFLLWMQRGKAERVFLAAEMFAPALAAVAAAVLLWGAASVRLDCLLRPAVSVKNGFWTAMESGGTFLATLPYIYKVRTEPAAARRGLGWLMGLAASPALFAAVTAGVLGPDAATLAHEPFFAMASALGRSFRVEGLVSALWILSDVVCLSLFSRCGAWEGKTIAGVVLIAGAGAGCFDFFGRVPQVFFGAGTLLLWGATAFVLMVGGKNCGPENQGKTTSCGQKENVKKEQEI